MRRDLQDAARIGTSATARCVDGRKRPFSMPEKKSAHEEAPESTPLKELATEKAGALHPKDTVQTAGDRMRMHNAGVWPVAEDRKLVGMIDEKNPDWTLGGHGHDPKDSRVRDIMHRDVIFCYEDEDCASATRKMDENSLYVLPVVDRELRIVGIFTRDEIQERSASKGAPEQPASTEHTSSSLET